AVEGIDRRNGYCQRTGIYHSLRPPVPLPPLSNPISVVSYVVALLRSPTTPAGLSSADFLIDAATGRRLDFSTFLRQVDCLSSSLRRRSISKNDVVFVLSPPSLQIPVLYFSLLSSGAVASPSNPLSSPSEVAHQIQFCRPKIAFTTAALSAKLPPHVPFVLLDSPEFRSMLQSGDSVAENDVVVNQSDPAAILYSSGTTGNVKGVLLTHRNLIAMTGKSYFNELYEEVKKAQEQEADPDRTQPVALFTLPLFHVFGFSMLLRAAALGHGAVVMERFDFANMLEAVERYRVTYVPVTPTLVVAMTKSDLTARYDLSSLQCLACGGAPLGKAAAEGFRAKFPDVQILQGYGLTETAGGVTRSIGAEEASRYGSAGRLEELVEAKIVNPETGESLPPGRRGELWLRGASVMKGYVRNEAATASALDSDGWLKTGDLCYFDSDGFLYIVDRLKELIKYKGYQVPPAELEQLLLSIPQIAEAAVVPYPDEEAGEIPVAFVVRKPGNSISAAQVMELVAGQVSPYKKIRRVSFVDAIPKTPAGKILRRELVQVALS
ncbi:hypothetical protein M569_07946, partial [Genlisea aurea]